MRTKKKWSKILDQIKIKKRIEMLIKACCYPGNTLTQIYIHNTHLTHENLDKLSVGLTHPNNKVKILE